MRQYPLLTREDEVRLDQAIEARTVAKCVLASGERCSPERRRALQRDVQCGDEAEQTFVQSNLRLVVHIAKRYHPSDLPLTDLIQEGNLGLMLAVEKYDWRRGLRFSTGATWWIRQAISRGLANSARTIRLPVHVGELVTAVHTAEAQLMARLGRFPTRADIAAELGLTEEKVEAVFRIHARPRSLSEPLREDGAGELGDIVEDQLVPSPIDTVIKGFRATAVTGLLAQLNEHEREILRLRFGLDRGEPRTLDEIGRQFNLTRERIRQIEAGAIAKLRHPASGPAVRDLLSS